MTEDEQSDANEAFLKKVQKLRAEVDLLRKIGSADDYQTKINEVYSELDSIDARSAAFLTDRDFLAQSELLKVNSQLLAEEVRIHSLFILRAPLIANATAISFFATMVLKDDYTGGDLIGLLLLFSGVLFSFLALLAYLQWKDVNLNLAGILWNGFLRNYFRLSDIKSINFGGHLKTRYLIGTLGSFLGFIFGTLTIIFF